LLTFPSFKGFVVFADFQLNRDVIAAENCENIEVDEHCKGTCHLVKEIKKENQEENKSPFSASDTSKLELLYFEAAPQLSLFKEQVEGSFFIYQNQHFSAHVMDVFHPPQSSVLS
jgi:hypothetical protein